MKQFVDYDSFDIELQQRIIAEPGRAEKYKNIRIWRWLCRLTHAYEYDCFIKLLNQGEKRRRYYNIAVKYYGLNGDRPMSFQEIANCDVTSYALTTQQPATARLMRQYFGATIAQIYYSNEQRYSFNSDVRRVMKQYRDEKLGNPIDAINKHFPPERDYNGHFEDFFKEMKE